MVLGDDGKEYGPATAEQVLAWKRDGRVDDDTQVRRAGESEWVPLSQIPELSGAAEEAPPPLPEAWATNAPVQEVRYGPLDALECYEQGWAFFKANASLLIGACAIVLAIQLTTIVHEVVAYAFAFVIAGPLYGGLARLILLTSRGQKLKVGEVFAGFRVQRNALMQASAARAAMELIVTIPLLLKLQGQDVPIYLLAICGVAGLYISLAYVFTFPLVIDRGLGFWEAMETSRRLVMAQPFRVILLGIIAGALVLLGLLCFGVGVLVTFPVAMAGYCYAYEHLVRSAE